MSPSPPEIKKKKKKKKSFCQKQHKLGCPRPPQIKKWLTKRQNRAFERHLKKNRQLYNVNNEYEK